MTVHRQETTQTGAMSSLSLAWKVALPEEHRQSLISTAPPLQLGTAEEMGLAPLILAVRKVCLRQPLLQEVKTDTSPEGNPCETDGMGHLLEVSVLLW